MRHHTMHKAPGAHLVREQREMLAKDWNGLVREGRRPTLRGFAKAHGIAYSTWRREFARGKVAETVPDPRRADRRQYAEYDPAAAGAKSVTTDNGCEFPGQEAIGREPGCAVHYTRACASWEKGSVENCSRIVRRVFPKGTDFSRCTRAEVAALERWVNSIHRPSPGGLTAAEFGAAGDARDGTRNVKEEKERE